MEIKLTEEDGDSFRHHEIQVTKTKNLIDHNSLDKNVSNIMATKGNINSFNNTNNDTTMATAISMPLTAKNLFTDSTLLKFMVLMSFTWWAFAVDQYFEFFKFINIWVRCCWHYLILGMVIFQQIIFITYVININVITILLWNSSNIRYVEEIWRVACITLWSFI